MSIVPANEVNHDDIIGADYYDKEENEEENEEEVDEDDEDGKIEVKELEHTELTKF